MLDYLVISLIVAMEVTLLLQFATTDSSQFTKSKKKSVWILIGSSLTTLEEEEFAGFAIRISDRSNSTVLLRAMHNAEQVDLASASRSRRLCRLSLLEIHDLNNGRQLKSHRGSFIQR